jgi:hypothetical protein
MRWADGVGSGGKLWSRLWADKLEFENARRCDSMYRITIFDYKRCDCIYQTFRSETNTRVVSYTLLWKLTGEYILPQLEAQDSFGLPNSWQRRCIWGLCTSSRPLWVLAQLYQQ